MTDPKQPFGIVTFGAEGEGERRGNFLKLLRECPIPDQEFLLNAGLFLTPQTLSRILFMDFLYRKILEVQGIVAEFGCRWGQNISLFTAMRGIYEPFNRLRKIVAFDTFEGLAGVVPDDGPLMTEGGYSVSKNYQQYLGKLLEFQEQESPLGHIKKHEIIPGDASETVPAYLQEHQETIIALAYFDMDIFRPTYDVLTAIKPYITRGTVLGFDEVNDEATPGETAALRDVLGIDRYAVRRYRYSARTSYLIID